MRHNRVRASVRWPITTPSSYLEAPLVSFNRISAVDEEKIKLEIEGSRKGACKKKYPGEKL